MEVPCVLNIAAVKLKSKDYDQAIYECNKVLDIEVRTEERALQILLKDDARHEASWRPI